MNKKLTFAALGIILAATPFTKTKAQESPNQLKVNLLPLTAGTFAVEYERTLVGSLTAVGMFSYRPEGKLPFFSSWSSLIDDADVKDALNNTTQGATSFAVEARWYPKAAMRGFYLAPYFKSANYKAGVPFNVDIDAADIDKIDADGTLKTITVGLGFGTQFRLGKKVTLDWKIMAPGYGSSNGTLKGKANRNLEPDEVAEIQEQLDENLADLPIVKAEADVKPEGVTVKVKGPWAGIRTGLSIGYRF